MNISNKRMPAEWENPTCILMAWPMPDSDWGFIIDDARRQFGRLIEAFTAHGESVLLLCKENPDTLIKYLMEFREFQGHKLRVKMRVDYNDTWTRDYGPITMTEEEGKIRMLDFGFNGWGLKFAADRDNLVNLQLAENGDFPQGAYLNHRDFILEGGSIESDGRGTILTTSHCLLSPNRNGGKTKEEIERILGEFLGAEKVLWLDYGFLEGDDTDSHIDTLARLAPNDTIVFVGAPEDKADPHFEELTEMRRQIEGFSTIEDKPYRLIELPFPDPVYDDDANRLPATYANYLVTGSHLFLPVYGQPAKDSIAAKQVSKAFPKHKIIPVDCTTLLWQHGSLHCSTMQLYHLKP